MNATRLLSRYRGALMGFAQLWIVLLHCWLLIIPNRPFLGAIESFVKWNGTLGVEIFLFLSGLSMTYAIRKGSLRSFYLGRLRRVLVPYWAMAALFAIAGRQGLSWFVLYATGVGSIMQNFQGHLWFIPAIIILYTLFPAYHALMMRTRDKTAFTLAALMLWLCAVILMRDALRYDLWVFVNRIPAFLLGIWLGEIGREKELILRAEHWLLFVLAMFAGFLLRSAGSRGMVLLIPEFAFAASWICAVPLCFLLAGLFSLLEDGKAGAVFRWPLRFLAFVGAFTLELYCCHQWVFASLYPLLEGRISYLGINLAVIPAALAAGWLFHLAHMAFWKLVCRAGKR
ncbi:MAG: acyltransferase [Clostridia bacterium]|nr:acyltransferase [Clostridia bacterium]